MYPFHWVPSALARHASEDPRPEGTFVYPTGTSVSTLCGLTEQSADNSELAWFWPTCEDCYEKARKIADSLP
ncbi:zinc finger protein [Saccharopolyspora sp. TS4A08]|uniref:Zinc finger protein n=1 Tax=Saccharopolyspora ipomoeae TaxID=3042027 RepID=A0ABT6PSG6_9PSEU|nr:zinc finger protein [Saccharopolyspora sp. TS4A08]MDI2030371.1 zinc finger protein [Saccharopolyspora sp. TS4A08]